MGILKKFFNNTRKPEGVLGKLMVNGMNSGDHARMADWALSSLPMQSEAEILDIGCGGGANIARMLQRVPNGSVTGVDYSTVSVNKSSKVNAKAITEGRCKVLVANATKLPFEANSFDTVTAFETIYFWPDIEHCFQEVNRTLKPGGRFAIINESDGSDPKDHKWEEIVDGMRIYSPDEISTYLYAAGFKDVKIRKNQAENWLMVEAVSNK